MKPEPRIIHSCGIERTNPVIEKAGWSARCRCGWISATHPERAAAIGEGRAHLVMVAKRDVPQTDAPPSPPLPPGGLDA